MDLKELSKLQETEISEQLKKELWDKHDRELLIGDMFNDKTSMLYKISQEYYIKPADLQSDSVSCTLRIFTYKIKMPAALGKYSVYINQKYTGNTYSIGESDDDGLFEIPANINEITGNSLKMQEGMLTTLCKLDMFKFRELNTFIDFTFVFKNVKQLQMTRFMLERGENIYGLSIDAMSKNIKVHPYGIRRNVLNSENWSVVYRYA